MTTNLRPDRSADSMPAQSLQGDLRASLGLAEDWPAAASLRELMRRRHAAKIFDGRPIAPEVLAELRELIRLTPTAFNLQPWRVVELSAGDRALRKRLADAAWNQPQLTSCSHLFVFCANTALEPLADTLEQSMLESGVASRSVAGFLAMLRSWIEGLGDARLAWAQRQTYLALAHALLGARALGLDSCPMEGFDPPAFARILELPGTIVPTALMPIGIATNAARPKLRFPIDQLFVAAQGTIA